MSFNNLVGCNSNNLSEANNELILETISSSLNPKSLTDFQIKVSNLIEASSYSL